MPLRNRVLPDGEIVEAGWRGLFMGNRGGRIHDPSTQTLTGRKWASRRWIICVTEFKNRRRTVMGSGYTELFFHDEPAALAAGHRPCFECRRKAANQFAHCWDSSVGLLGGKRADEMDLILHEQRQEPSKLITIEQAQELPDGTYFKNDQRFFVLRNSSFWLMRDGGYVKSDLAADRILLLTPPAILKVLEAGYEPDFHTTTG